MGRFQHLQIVNYLRKYAAFTLACSWVLGLFLGIWAAAEVSLDAVALIAAFQNKTSISLLTVMLFPVLVSILIIYMEQPWLLLVLAFLKSFCFAYVSFALTDVFGSVGRLIQLLVMFSDCFSFPFLWWFWCRLLQSPQKSLFSLSAPVVIGIIAIGVLDISFISPILSSLQISL